RFQKIDKPLETNGIAVSGLQPGVGPRCRGIGSLQGVTGILQSLGRGTGAMGRGVAGRDGISDASAPAVRNLSPRNMAKEKSNRAARADAAIEVRGARQNNLKGVDLDIPIGKLTVMTGPSGSGKSSLAFQTLYAEGQRRYVET